MSDKLKLISSDYLKSYSSAAEVDWKKLAVTLRSKTEIAKQDFEFYAIASSVFSSKIEGNSLDLNSFMRNRGAKKTSSKKEVEEIENLISAYSFASTKKLTEKNFLEAHSILSKTLLKKSERGKFRKVQVGVYDSYTGKPVYLATEPDELKLEISKLFADINFLSKKKVSTKESFYYASMIHLHLAMIHPFADGNGRAARLLEKWFLSSAIGAAAWSIASEKFYWDNRPEYYKNISLGFNYYAIHWERCVPFLLMLVKSI